LLSRWKETLEVPTSRFFGVEKEKSERGRKKEGASSKVRRKKAREVPKPKRVWASLQFEK
jgi:hypothetical protein